MPLLFIIVDKSLSFFERCLAAIKFLFIFIFNYLLKDSEMENQLLITLSRNKLLKNVDISSINLRGIIGRLVTIGEGEILYREGDPAEEIYLVISGEINVLKKRLLGKTKSYIFTENDFLGHDEYFEETSRTSTAVALRDSYLITLSRNEIDLLIKQNDEIIVNLREPVSQLDDEALKTNAFTPLKEEFTSNEVAPQFTSEIEPEEEPDYLKSQPDTEEPPSYFNSISDVSKSGYDNLIQPLEKISFTGVPENKPEETKGEENKDSNFPFNDSSFFNEDGIPKSEFELPDLEDKPAKMPDQTFVGSTELDDALFNILSGSDSFDFEKKPPLDENFNKEDDSFFSTLTKEYTSTPEIKEIKAEGTFSTKEESELNDDKLPNEEQHDIPKREITISPYPRTTKEYGAEEIFDEADQKLKELENAKAHSAKFSNEFDKKDQGKELMSRDELEMIIQAAQIVNSTVRVDEALKAIVDVAAELTNADRGSLYLVEKEKGEIWSLVALGEEMKEIRLKIGEGLAGYVAKTGETINIPNVQKDPRFKSDYDKSSGYVTKNMICFPIKNKQGEIIGVLQLLNCAHGEFTKRDEEFLNALSVHSAIAIQNAELVEKLLQTERVHSLGKMANFLIQDIKKPVLVSKRYAEHLLTKQLTADVAQVIEMLLEQLTQVADIVQTTSSYSEGKTILRTLSVSLNNTLADYKSRVDAYVENRKSQIKNELDKDVTVKLDVKEFFQTYMHIIKNACDAMPDGGQIVVSTKRTDKNVKILIKDNGLGISEALKDKIFEPFMSYGKKEGTGLGLSITRKLVEAHSGKIEVESTVGQGATFIITLPVATSY